MADFQFNISLGREIEFYNRVDTADPANCALIVVVLADSGIETDAVLKDKDTLAAVVSGTTNEATNSVRKTITGASLTAFAPDDNANTITVGIPVQTYTTPASGDSWRKALVCYDPDTTGGTDSDIIPITAHDLLINGVAVVPPGGVNVVIDLSAGFVVAS